MSQLDASLAALRAREPMMHALLERLVNINSHTANVTGVNAAGEALIEALASLPLTLEVEAAPSGAHHLVFATAAAENQPSTLLIGHHDTVFPPGVFEGYTVDGDVARGPGVLDMKGGLAIIVAVLHALRDAGALERLPLRFVCVADEEVGSPSGRKVIEPLVARAREALVFEAGRKGDAVIVARRGSGNALVRAFGKAAHAGNALSEGRSAIWALARFVDLVESARDQIAGSSASVGLIEGGSARNTVPEGATAQLDLRFRNQAGQDAVIALLQHAAQGAETAVAGTRVEVEINVTRKPWMASESSRALAARYGACARAAGLQYVQADVIGGGSDANTVGALGLPAIDGLGPRGAGFHTRDEYIELSSLRMKAEALLRLLLDT